MSGKNREVVGETGAGAVVIERVEVNIVKALYVASSRRISLNCSCGRTRGLIRRRRRRRW